MGIFARIMVGLAAEAPDNKTISIDATYLKAQPHRDHVWSTERLAACRNPL
ncbi:hypothetical protein SAMN05444358_101140 [Ruegeria halocynthiae]|uniref:Transposase n=1 Tax=Ruegeria halocynthiae TaxID=985054 RepID=A0A1H2RF94_9RHOB|nr:hypothetical protein SAMN05444358_101140 [Ruegeria halocynthiae]